MVTYTEKPPVAPRNVDDVANRLATAAWGTFFIWVGYALMVGLDMGVGLLGVGVITLGAQAGRKAFALPLEGFWVLAGVVMVAGGLWSLLALAVPMAPLVFAGLGGEVLIIGAVLGRRGDDDG